MIKKLYSFAIVFLCAATGAFAQAGQGSLKGKVLDGANNDPVPFANVVVELGGTIVAGATTDFDGNYNIKPITPGKYDVRVSYVGYQPKLITGVIIKGEQISFLNISITQGIELKAVTIEGYKVPLIDKGNTSSGGTVTREDIAKMPGRSAESVAITIGGVYSADGERGSIRGSRDDATDTYIDGVKVRGSSNIPNSAIEQVSVIVGGLPAQYGDATGGIISITTRGVSPVYFGGVEMVTSQLTDKYGYNLLGGNLSGPLLSKRDPLDSTKKKPLLGFFLSTEVNYQKDRRPSAIGSFRAKDEIISALEQDPLRANPSGAGTIPNSNFVYRKDLENIAARENVESKGIVAQGKVDLVTSATTSFTLGGTFDRSSRRDEARTTVYRNSLFNSANNPVFNYNTWRVYSRFTQRLGEAGADDEANASNIKNAYYSIQLDYSKYTRRAEDINHKDNFFNYGHIGRFDSKYENFYLYGKDSVTGEEGYIHETFLQTDYDFDAAGSKNPVLARYTERLYELAGGLEQNIQNTFQVESFGGLLNGQYPGDVYGLWSTPGVPYNQYDKLDQGAFRIRATGSADIKDHSILIGFEYEQRNDKRFVMNPRNLWTRARQLSNTHIDQLDKSSVLIEDFGTYKRYTYNRLNAAPGEYTGEDDEQSFFDYNIRKALNLNPDGLDFLLIDTLRPEFLKLDYFTAGELLDNGNTSAPLSTYYGYDHTGKKLKNKPSFDDFFNDKDEFGNFKRHVGAYEPIYMSGYIQDKFAFEDLIFNIGVRVDRFDANQKVLKDKYSLFETVKAGELDITGRPANIGDDFVVYVSDVNNPSAKNILGYRDGDIWYDSKGKDISQDPTVLNTSTGRVAPFLLDPTKSSTLTDLRPAAFKDYNPQVNFMPRIAFSFPISDEALFFAHYDILTQRPNFAERLDLTEYLFLQNTTGRINNPDLKPQKTIDYELGFQQKLNSSSSLKFASFYREMRDLIQAVKVVGGFPRDYITYGNRDFGTVKGATITYDLRRTGNVRLNTSYTLQFAQGTGSNEETGLNVLNQPGGSNLRTISPLDFDQRHNIVTTFDYRYGSGKNYNGPVLFDKQIFSETGVNLIFRGGSGRPYTAQKNITQQGDEDAGGRSLVKGGINTARFPWQFTTDMRIDRDINLKWGKNEEAKKEGTLNVYVLLLNAFDAKNILNVYRGTGNPDDDGYLAAAQFQANIQSQNDELSYRDLYAVKINNPFNYSLPRRIRLGLIFNF